MLTVAPRGSTKLVTRLLTPAPFSMRSMVNGRVAELLRVVNAVSRAGAITRTWRKAGSRPTSCTSSGRVTRPWISRAASTVPP